MGEGFDVGLEMFGNPSGFRDMIANMSHGAKIEMLSIPSEEMAIDWRAVIFHEPTVSRASTAVKCTTVGLGYQPGNYASLSLYGVRPRLRSDGVRQFRQSGSQLGVS
jgi:hypothetical protein